MSDVTGKTTGERIKHFHHRVGMTRPVLGGLVGRSAEWVKAVEIDSPQLRPTGCDTACANSASG